MLTGPPRINTTLLPLASKGGALRAQWDPSDSLTALLRSGEIIVRQVRLRGRFRFGYAALEEAPFDELVTLLRLPTFNFTPRTAAAGEDAADERTYACRCTAELPDTRPLYRGFFFIEVEVETTGLYDENRTLIA